jgi:hypothetical protein
MMAAHGQYSGSFWVPQVLGIGSSELFLKHLRGICPVRTYLTGQGIFSTCAMGGLCEKIGMHGETPWKRLVRSTTSPKAANLDVLVQVVTLLLVGLHI